METKIALVTGGSRGLGKDIAISIASCAEHRKKTNDFVREVESDRHDRHLRIVGNVIKPGLPLGHILTRSFRSDNENELVSRLVCMHSLAHPVFTDGALDRNSAEPSHEWAKRPPEDCMLSKKRSAKTERKIRPEPNDEIPVGCVRRDDHHELGLVR